ANKIGGRDRRKRRKQEEEAEATRGKGVYAQPKLSPDQYVGDFDEVPIGLPGSAPCSLRVCCCCLNAGEFETISNREEKARFPCCPCLTREKKKLPNRPKGSNEADGTAAEGSTLEEEQQSAGEETDDDEIEADRWGREPLGRRGWRICLTMGFLPCALPCRASEQHKKLTELYPVESTLKKKSGVCGRIKAAVFFPWMLAKHVAFLRERRWADELRYPWQTRAAWTVPGRPPSALFKILVLGDNGVGKTALARALCGKGFLPEYSPDTAVSVSARSFSRDKFPPAVLEIWDVPASAKTSLGPEIAAETSCALLLLDLDDRNSFRVAKRWQSLVTQACSGSKARPPHFIVVGTKIDVTPASRCCFLKGVDGWCEEQGYPLLFCTSFAGEGIMGILREIVVTCFDRHPPPAVLKDLYLAV
ncbi:unnamed protein product, partial [Ectocarpus fasciculatus]